MVIQKLTKSHPQKTENKFKIWDELSKDESEENKKVRFKLFKDPTIFAYAMLKDEENKPLKLYAYQDLIINDKSRHVMFCAGRQIGKTIMLCVKALHHALFVENALIVIVSRSEPQAIYLLDQIKRMMLRSDIPFASLIGEVENRMELEIKRSDEHISKIMCMPATERGRGYSPTLLLLDEIAYWEAPNKETDATYLYQSIYEPSISATRDRKHEFLTMGQIVACSSPNGQQGIFWNMWNDDRFSKYKFSWLIKPGRTVQEYEALKKTMPAMRFESEYAAEFITMEGGFITEWEYDNAVRRSPLIIPPEGLLFFGGDFAGEDTITRDVDYTVLYGVLLLKEKEDEPPKIRLVWQREYPRRVLKQSVYNDLIAFKDRIGKFAYDKVGVGDSVRNDLIEKGILNEFQIEVLTYSLPNKSEVYYNLQHLFEQGRIEISEQAYEQLKNQLLGLQFELKRGTTNMKLHHKEGFHDDHADAFANACFAAIRLSQAQPNIVRMDMEEPRIDKEGRFINKEKYAECLKCEANWKYNNEEECPDCGAEKKNLVWYTTGEKIK